MVFCCLHVCNVGAACISQGLQQGGSCRDSDCPTTYIDMRTRRNAGNSCQNQHSCAEVERPNNKGFQIQRPAVHWPGCLVSSPSSFEEHETRALDVWRTSGSEYNFCLDTRRV